MAIRRSYLAGDFKQDITFDPIFGYVMSKKENCLHLLQIALPELHLKEIIEISPQKPIDMNLFEKSSRFDIFAKDDKNRVYDIEMQNVQLDFLPERAWYYLRQLQNKNAPKKGEDYDKINASYVIFFCRFDPFDEDRAVYHFDFSERENHRRIMDQAGHIMFFNSKGKNRENIGPQMAEFLDYLNGHVQRPSKYIAKLNNDIEEYISTPEWGEVMDQISLLREDMAAEAVEKMIRSYRKYFNLSDEKILSILLEEYGDTFSEDQLKEFIKETK